MSTPNIFEGLSIGVDMDSVITNWPKATREKLFEKIPYIGKIPTVEEQKIWYFEQNFPEKFHEEIARIYFNPDPGFYYDMEPIRSAIEKLYELKELGVNLAIVTSPVPTGKQYLKHYNGNPALQIEAYLRVVKEKAMWLHKHAPDLEMDFMPIHAKDKFNGKYLIDDHPDAAKGKQVPWKQIYFNNNYGWLNGNKNCQPQANWNNMIETIERIEESRTTGSRSGFGSEGC